MTNKLFLKLTGYCGIICYVTPHKIITGVIDMKKYKDEKDGQRDFYYSYLALVNRELTIENVLSDNTDGVINGNLLEFKININDLNAVLFQAIKYLSGFRIKGKSVPANIILISLNDKKAYLYKSDDYLSYIEKVYQGAASKDNTGFSSDKPTAIYYYDDDLEEAKMIDVLRSNNFLKINIDENCIVGWANRYYNENPSAKKSDFIGDETGKVKIIGEIRAPKHFKQFINPYVGKDNVKFKYLMDKLNDTLSKKNLGAFYTPQKYCEKSVELVRKAIARVPDGNDYVIIDRCAGTGNLEAMLSDEELSHTIISTIEYYEYKVLMRLFGDKVKHIIPPTEKEDTFNMGLVRGADALSKEYIENPVIKQYIDNPKCTIILFENPPYAETTSAEHQRANQAKKSSTWKNSYVVQQMKKEVSGTVSNDLGNAFIWSAFKYYLRQPTDSYIVYSPCKYWKAQHLINKKFIDGYAFNRKHFHTNIEACIMVALWSNEEDISNNEISLEAYNIIDDELDYCDIVPIKRIYTTYSKIYYDKRAIPSESRIGILCGLDGTEKIGGNQRNKPATSDEIIGYMVAHSSGFDNPDLDSSLLVGARYDGNGFFLRKDNYLEKLPMFCASRYITYNREWTERARIMKSADGSERFFGDVKNHKLDTFLLKCLLFTCLEMQNHMRTFLGSDERFYRNELCLDDTNGETIGSTDIKKLILNSLEEKLLEQWNKVLQAAKSTKEYNSKLTYGVYQIYSELDICYKDEETGKTKWIYPDLHGHLQTLKNLVKEYYNMEIVPVLFKYEFLK